MNAISDDVKCYRIGRFLRVIGIVFVIFVLVVGIGAAVEDHGKGILLPPTQSVINFAIAWSCLAAFGLAFNIYCARYRLCVSSKSIVQKGLIWTRSLDVSDIAKVTWRTNDLCVVLQAAATRMRIELKGFSSADRDEIISWLRGVTDSGIHEAWPRFEKLLKAKREPISVVRIAIGTAAAAAVAVPLLYLAAWLTKPQNTGFVFVLLFYLALAIFLFVARVFGWRPRSHAEDRPAA